MNQELTNPKILLISYYFPPYNKVGGRRWAKHFKYLNIMGIETHVLSKNFPGLSSSWDKDILEYNKTITRIDISEPKVPYFKKKLPSTILEKMRWKLSFWKSKIIHAQPITSNNISENTAPLFFEAAVPIILKESINTVILSIGPYKYSEVLILLKVKFPFIKFVLDDRDYWNEEFEKLNSTQLLAEKEFQKNVMNSVDLILTPYQEMKVKYETSFNKRVYCLPHCVDTDDIQNSSSSAKTDTIKIIYGGAFYSNIEDNIILIKEIVSLLSGRGKKVNVNFFVSVKGYEKELEHPLIKRFDFIDTSEYFSKVQEADYVILILPPNRVNAMSSKFFELVALRKPILYFGGVGDVSEYLIKYRLGYHITSENLTTSVDEILSNITTQNIPDKNYDVSLHTFKYQTKLLVDTLNQL